MDSPKPPKSRISMSLALLNHARHVAFGIAGASKREMVRSSIAQCSLEPPATPAGMVHTTGDHVHWVVDTTAAPTCAQVCSEVQHSPRACPPATYSRACLSRQPAPMGSGASCGSGVGVLSPRSTPGRQCTKESTAHWFHPHACWVCVGDVRLVSKGAARCQLYPCCGQ